MSWPKALFVLMGRVGKAKALREGDRNDSNRETWNIKLDLYSFLQTIDQCSKRMPTTPFTIWSGEEKLNCVRVGNTPKGGKFISFLPKNLNSSNPLPSLPLSFPLLHFQHLWT